MRQADFTVGGLYAYPTFNPHDGPPAAAQVEVVTIDGGGQVTVVVVDPGPKPKHSWQKRPRRNERLQLATRAVSCPWDQWEERAAAEAAEEVEREARVSTWRQDYEQRRVDRVSPDPHRVLPTKYDETREYLSDEEPETLAALVQAYIQHRGLGQRVKREKIEPLISQFPVTIARDIIAALSPPEDCAADSVAAVFRRTADILEDSRISNMSRRGRNRHDYPQRSLIGEPELTFVATVRDHFAATGDELRLPWVPRMPEWLDDEDRVLAETFGWLRVGVADTGGQLIHSVGCRSVNSRSLEHADHIPLWAILVENKRLLCSVCGGPGFRDLVPLAEFIAAVDVWSARNRDSVEPWQRIALLRLIAASAYARAAAEEPEVTLAGRITETLGVAPPGREGWQAYHLLNRSTQTVLDSTDDDDIPTVDEENILALCRTRLTLVEQQLPNTMRPDPLADSANATDIRRRYRQLHDTIEIPGLDRLLFGLPGAI
ncbi:hypothetical protein [Nocardia sp. BMG51109]|uniref:hypothetical protein n=1 Tax=Nocardia sp. BMG51109 TaxID=1056816 RepID=UPI0012EB9EFA|nr:hypothetical protein [Nocardia sp. BMG51109]